MEIDDALLYLLPKIPKKPSVFIIYTNALGKFPDILNNPRRIKCKNIPNFPLCVDSNTYFIYGERKKVPILVMQGRMHIFEGMSLKDVAFPVQLAYHLGCENMFITNASGSINQNYELGDLILIKDHVYLFSMLDVHEKWEQHSKRYDRKFFNSARKLAIDCGIEDCLHEGVFSMIARGNFQSTAETEAIISLGADVVGMSTIPEVLTAFHYDISVFGLSIVTDKGIFDNYDVPNIKEVTKAVRSKKDYITKLIIKYIEYCKPPTDDSRETLLFSELLFSEDFSERGYL